MAVNYKPGVYRTSGGDEEVVASSGRILVQSGGTLNMASGATLTLTGQAVASTGAGTFNSVTSTGAITGETFSSTGATSGTAKFKSVTSTGTITGDSFTSTGGTAGSGKFNSVTSTGTGTFNAVTSTGTITGDSFTSTGGTAGSGKFNSVTSTGTGTFNALASTGTVSGQVYGLYGLKRYIETATTSWTDLAGYGVSIVKSTAATWVYNLPAPVAGMEKIIVAMPCTAGVISICSSGANAGVNGNTSILLSSGLAADPEWIHLIGQNTTNWMTVGYTTDVTFSST